MAKAYQERLVALVKDTITLLCKNGLEYSQEFSVEGLLGVTLDKDEVFLIPIKELVADKAVGTSEAVDGGSLDVSVEDGDDAKSPRQVRKKKRRHNHTEHAEDTTVQDESNHANVLYESQTPTEWNTDSDEQLGVLGQDIQTESEPTPKRRHRNERREELRQIKEEDIVVIKEEVSNDEFVGVFQDGSLDGNALNQTDQMDASMAFFNPAGVSDPGGRINFPLDQLAGGSSLQSGALQGIPPGAEGDASWLQDSQGDTSNSQDWQGQKHQVCIVAEHKN